MEILSRKEVVEQSKRAFDRWCDIWHENAKKNSDIGYTDSNKPIRGSQDVVICAFGPSLIDNIKSIVENKIDEVLDVVCIDKSLKTLLENDVVPNYCVVADAQVDFDKYGNIDPKLCRRIDLFCAVTANYKWAEYWKNNGGNVHFYLNKDNIRTHKIFGKYFDGKKKHIIPASSNVGNSAYVFSSLVMGYQRILLAGYDYSYKLLGNYYGNNSKPKDTNTKHDKHKCMNHNTLFDVKGDIVQASDNMVFSAKWLIGFINQMEKEKISVTINCTGAGILTINNQGKFKKEVA